MILNTAHFYIRTDEKGVFEDIITDVRKKLTTDAPEINLSITKNRRTGVKPIRPVLKHREVPTVLHQFSGSSGANSQDRGDDSRV